MVEIKQTHFLTLLSSCEAENSPALKLKMISNIIHRAQDCRTSQMKFISKQKLNLTEIRCFIIPIKISKAIMSDISGSLEEN